MLKIVLLLVLDLRFLRAASTVKAGLQNSSSRSAIYSKHGVNLFLSLPCSLRLPKVEESNQQRITSPGFAGFELLRGVLSTLRPTQPFSVHGNARPCASAGVVVTPKWRRWRPEQPAEERPAGSRWALPTPGKSSSPVPETHGPPRAWGRGEAQADLSALVIYFLLLFLSLVQWKKPARPPLVCRGAYAPRRARGPPRKPPAPLACPEPLDTERRFAARGPGRETVLGGPWGRWRRPWRAHVDAALRWARRRTAVTGAAAPTGAVRGLGPSLLGRAAKASPPPPAPSEPAGGPEPLLPSLAPRESGPRVGAGCRGRRELRPRPSRLPKPLAGGAEAAGRGVPAGLRRGGFPDCVSVCTRRGSASCSGGNPRDTPITVTYQESTEHKHSTNVLVLHPFCVVFSTRFCFLVCCEGIPN